MASKAKPTSLSLRFIAQPTSFPENQTYALWDIWPRIIGTFAGQFGAFVGLFFGIHGPNNEWPYAWWAFVFLFTSFLLAWLTSKNKAATLVSTGSEFRKYNLWGAEIWNGKLEDYESVGIETSLWSGGLSYVVFVRTEKHILSLKQKHRWCACCVGKRYCFPIREIDDFWKDHGFNRTTTAQHV